MIGELINHICSVFFFKKNPHLQDFIKIDGFVLYIPRLYPLDGLSLVVQNTKSTGWCKKDGWQQWKVQCLVSERQSNWHSNCEASSAFPSLTNHLNCIQNPTTASKAVHFHFSAPAKSLLHYGPTVVKTNPKDFSDDVKAKHPHSLQCRSCVVTCTTGLIPVRGGK